MPVRRFEPNWRDRILSGVGVVAAWALTGRWLLTDPVSLLSLAWLVIAVLNTGVALESWRGYVAADDEGITVHRGIGRIQHVPWPHVRGIRTGRPRGLPAVERSDGRDILLRRLMARSELDELARMASSRVERGGRRDA